VVLHNESIENILNKNLGRRDLKKDNDKRRELIGY
jgi:hypothetical protein